MTVTNRKSKGKVKASSSNVVGISTRETKEDVTSLTIFGDEEFAFAADTTHLSHRRLDLQAILETVLQANGKLPTAS